MRTQTRSFWMAYNSIEEKYKVKPITPDEVASHKALVIPEAVMKVWNDLIAKNWTGRKSQVMQDEAVKAIMSATDVKRNEVFDNRWLDIEPIYRQAGWHVEYDKPAYNESYEASFTFTRGKVSD